MTLRKCLQIKFRENRILHKKHDFCDNPIGFAQFPWPSPENQILQKTFFFDFCKKTPIFAKNADFCKKRRFFAKNADFCKKRLFSQKHCFWRKSYSRGKVPFSSIFSIFANFSATL
jgi:hypothetical protein